MKTVQTALQIQTLADLLERLGGISADRVRFQPPPGTALEQDVIEVERRENRLCELVDGALVEKLMGYRESLLAVALAAALRDFVVERNLGLVTGADGLVSLISGLVRIPDVALVSWNRLPERQVPTDPIPHVAPDLAVEVLSKGNTAGEMERKRREYFQAGVSLVWMVDVDARTVTVFTSPERSRTLNEDQILDGGEVLAGFSLSLRELFAELDRQGDS